MAIIQRFGAALNLNVHVHALVLDGVYVEDGGILRFHEAMPPTDDEMDRLLGTIDRRGSRGAHDNRHARHARGMISAPTVISVQVATEGSTEFRCWRITGRA